jgi:hypothetical protein
VLRQQATDCANAAYMPTRQELCKAAGIADSELLVFEPQTTPARPAYAVWLDSAHKTVVFGFRGTTDLNVSLTACVPGPRALLWLGWRVGARTHCHPPPQKCTPNNTPTARQNARAQDMLTDACASCEPYCGGWAHWGMHEAASWFVEHELSKVVDIVKQQGAGWQLLLVGHSLGAGAVLCVASRCVTHQGWLARCSGVAHAVTWRACAWPHSSSPRPLGRLPRSRHAPRARTHARLQARRPCWRT